MSATVRTGTAVSSEYKKHFDIFFFIHQLSQK